MGEDLSASLFGGKNEQESYINLHKITDITACLIHKGPYDKVSPCWKSLYGWVFRNRYTPAGPCREVWLNNPDEVPANSLLTEIQVPIKKR